MGKKYSRKPSLSRNLRIACKIIVQNHEVPLSNQCRAISIPKIKPCFSFVLPFSFIRTKLKKVFFRQFNLAFKEVHEKGLTSHFPVLATFFFRCSKFRLRLGFLNILPIWTSKVVLNEHREQMVKKLDFLEFYTVPLGTG